MSHIILILLIWNCSLITGFHIKSHFPPSTSSHFPRLRTAETLPSLQQFTVCSWIKFYSNNNERLTLMSYFIRYSVQIAISLKKFGSDRRVELNISFNKSFFSCSSKWIIGEWYHLCVTWSSPIETFKVYQNGNICEYTDGYRNFKRTIIPSGGILIIGQHQMGMDSKYDANQSWHGDIADLQIWDEELSVYQVQVAGKCNGKMKAGNVFCWMKTRLIATDNVIFSETRLCYP